MTTDELAAVFRSCRQAARRTMRDAALLSGSASAATISNWEAGQCENIAVALTYLEAYGITLISSEQLQARIDAAFERGFNATRTG